VRASTVDGRAAIDRPLTWQPSSEDEARQLYSHVSRRDGSSRLTIAAIPKGRSAVQDNVEPMPGRKPVGFEPGLRDLVSVIRADGLVGRQESFGSKKLELAQAFSTVRRSEIRDD